MQSEHIKITSNGGFIVCLSLVAITTWCRIAFWNLLAYFRIFYCGKVNSLTFHYIADSPQLWWRLQVKHRQRGNHWQHLYEQKSQAVPQSKDVKHWWFSSHCSHRNLGYAQPVSLKKKSHRYMYSFSTLSRFALLSATDGSILRIWDPLDFCPVDFLGYASIGFVVWGVIWGISERIQ